MRDQRLRELERRFKESGALADEVAWLQARVRAGELSRSELRVAAHCGHLPAQQAAELPPPDPDQELRAWVGDLEERSPACVAAALAALREVLEVCDFDEEEVTVDLAAVRATLAALEAWVAQPAAEEAARAAALGQRLPGHFYFAREACLQLGTRHLALALRPEAEAQSPSSVARAIFLAVRALTLEGLAPDRARRRVKALASQAALVRLGFAQPAE